MGKRSRTKGRNFELEVVKLAGEAGIPAIRNDQYLGVEDGGSDVILHAVRDRGHIIHTEEEVIYVECKAEQRLGIPAVVRILHDPKERVDAVAVKIDRLGSIVAQPLSRYLAREHELAELRKVVGREQRA